MSRVSDLETVSKENASNEFKEESPIEAGMTSPPHVHNELPYRLYKRRFLGLLGMVCFIVFCPWWVYQLYAQVILNIVAGLSWPWFGPIANNSKFLPLSLEQYSNRYASAVVSDFDITLNEVSWLGTIEACIYLPMALSIPYLYSRFGLRRCVRCPNISVFLMVNQQFQCDIGAIALVLSAWIRYAGTVKSLSSKSAYTLLMFGQVIFQQAIMHTKDLNFSYLVFCRCRSARVSGFRS